MEQAVSTDLVGHLRRAISEAGDNIKIHDIRCRGLTSPLIRGLLNEVCNAEWVSYLEVGAWCGATFVTALYENHPAYAIGIDNFTEVRRCREQFNDTCKRYAASLPPYEFVDGDCWGAVDRIKKPINVYFYDGGHTELDHYRALAVYLPMLADEFIYLCDDWLWDQVRSGTLTAIKDLGLKVLYERHLPARYDGDMDQWWNGLGAFVLRKP